MKKTVLVLMIVGLLFVSFAAFAGGGGEEPAMTGKPFEGVTVTVVAQGASCYSVA